MRKALGLVSHIEFFEYLTMGQTNRHAVLMTANIHTDADFEGDRRSHGALLQVDTSPDAHPWVSSIYRATITTMGTIPNDPLDDAGNGGGISGSSELVDTSH